jgi:hypothetical protein
MPPSTCFPLVPQAEIEHQQQRVKDANEAASRSEQDKRRLEAELHAVRRELNAQREAAKGISEWMAGLTQQVRNGQHAVAALGGGAGPFGSAPL